MGGHPCTPNVPHLRWGTTAVVFWVYFVPQNIAAVFLWAAEEKKMEQTEKIALLAGRIIRLEKSAARLSKDLSAVVKELAEISEQLTSHQSPFGPVYPRPEICE